MSLIRSSYRWFNAKIVNPYILPIWLSQRYEIQLGQDEFKLKKNRRIWFHAASVGELEALWPVILLAAEQKNELILTILSHSAESSLKKLVTSLSSLLAEVIYQGYSPWEGQWKSSFVHTQPDLFVTAKYEAWPDLWMSLQECNIPLVIVSAKERKSLRVAKWFCSHAGEKLPSLKLLPALSTDIQDLKNLFPNAWVESVGDPRWDRVFSRMQTGSPRAGQMIEKYQMLKKPWGIVGSAWIEDLSYLRDGIAELEGTLWVVPHEIDPKNVEKMRAYLQECGLDPVLTASTVKSSGESSLEKLGQQKLGCLIVNEMGFLTELYSMADWAFIGGGFGAGIHSTIEPAIHGIPIAAGPSRADRFSETEELVASGQLTLMTQRTQLKAWIQGLSAAVYQRNEWIRQAQARRGASQKIFDRLEKF